MAYEVGKRGFKPVALRHNQNAGQSPTLPKRGTARSAGYDFYSPRAFSLEPGEQLVLYTDVKAYMGPDEVLMISPRSSLGNRGMQLANTVGIIDADYYENPDNDGNIGLIIRNNSRTKLLSIEVGDRIAQGIFLPHLLADGDDVTTERQGGLGSSGQ